MPATATAGQFAAGDTSVGFGPVQWPTAVPQQCPQIQAPAMFGQMYPVKVPLTGVDVGNVPVLKCHTVHVPLLLPPLARFLLEDHIACEYP